ncbi:hypothetical protein DYB36_002617 [Aphanomyces astaci]|uniref:Uncharacterized protein n=1 Tax=Aphanomyces astaci TaxID=112090 RepID=A0A397AIC6_APHAT|nr:hypothetical protein DYB36_002617 [Aphanomyces astaci]
MPWWWRASPWVVKTRAKSTYVERQESGTGLSIRHPWKRVVAAMLLLGLNNLVHLVNPVAMSRAPVSIPVYGTAFNFLCRPTLLDDTLGTVVTSVLPVRYVDLYPAVRAYVLIWNGLVLFCTWDVMLQDHIRCDTVFDNWMFTFRWHVWRHQWVRISCFWLVVATLVAYAAVGLPPVHAALTQRFLDHVSTDLYFNESWRAVFSGAVVMLDVVYENSSSWTFVADVVATLGRFFSWPIEDKFPAVCLVAYVVFFQMQGVKQAMYRRQLDSATLPPHAVLDLVRLADIKRYYWLRRHSDDICVGLSLFGLVMMLLQLRCIWQVMFATETYPSNMVSTPGQTYALLIFISTLLLVFELVRRFRLTVDILKLRQKLAPTTTMWRHPRIRAQVAVELIVNMAIVPPFVTGMFVVNEYQMRASTCPPPVHFSCFHRIQPCAL